MISPLLEKIYTTECVEDKEGNSINIFPDATPKILAEFLYEYVRQYDCQNTLEIGMAFGLSTLAICQAIEHRGAGSHIAIDPYQHRERY